MSSNRLPADDLELEIEEVESLMNAPSSSSSRRSNLLDNLVKIKFTGVTSKVRPPPPTRGRFGIGTFPDGTSTPMSSSSSLSGLRRSNNGSSSVRTSSSLSSRCYSCRRLLTDRCTKSRSALLVLIVAAAIVLLVYNGEGEVKELEKGGQASLSDVEGKANLALSTTPEALTSTSDGIGNVGTEAGNDSAPPPPPPSPMSKVHPHVVTIGNGKTTTSNLLLRPAVVPSPAKEDTATPAATPSEPENEAVVKKTTPAPLPSPGPTPSPTPGPTLGPTLAPTMKPVEEGKNDTKEEHETKGEDAEANDGSATPNPTPAPAPVPQPDDGPWHSPDIDPDRKKALVDRWGQWHFWDSDVDTRPQEDYCGRYPHRDVPDLNFPETSWQIDAVYVNHFLDDASNLIERAQEAIYAEYGHGKPEDNSALPTAAMLERIKMFKVQEVDLSTATMPPDGYDEGGGWSTKRSLDGLKRRLLHAMMTNDSFTVVMGGTNAAAGGGNHFSQSYPMQFHAVMEPIFARLGVKLITRNVGQENLGTLHNGLGSGSIYGDEVDMIVWDSEETEESASQLDLIARQALLAGKRIPILWGGSFDVLKDLHEKADVDVGQHGWGWSGVPVTTPSSSNNNDDDAVSSLPWAVRYLRCDGPAKSKCDKPEIKFSTRCWIERDDITPPAAQDAHLDGQDASHPGHRWHRLLGRVLAFTVLIALQDAVSTWSEITIFAGHPLPAEHWHIGEYYKNIRDKVAALESGSCGGIREYLPERLCRVPVKARTEYTPRTDPERTSISSIIRPTKDGYVPSVQEAMLYDGPDKENPATLTLAGEVDVVEIVSLGIDQDKKDDGRRILRTLEFWRESAVGTVAESWPSRSIQEAAALSVPPLPPPQQQQPPPHPVVRRGDRSLSDGDDAAIVPGSGWEIVGELPGRCDGTASGRCGRVPSSKCLLSGHVDSRGGVLGNEYSGWLVMDIKDVREGIIVLKLETDHVAGESKRTEGWTAVDGKTRRLGEAFTSLGNRSLLPDGFEFDVAIDGQIQTLNEKEFEAKLAKPQDKIQFLTVLNDPSVKKDIIEVAIRLRGCGQDCTIALTHVYWA